MLKKYLVFSKKKKKKLIFFAKHQYHLTEIEETTLKESTTKAERITSGRFSLLRHKAAATVKANFAASSMGCNITRPTGPNKRAAKESQNRVEN